MNRRIFAFTAVLLMAAGAFFCCSVVDDEGSSAETLAYNTPYSWTVAITAQPMATLYMTYPHNAYYTHYFQTDGSVKENDYASIEFQYNSGTRMYTFTLIIKPKVPVGTYEFEIADVLPGSGDELNAYRYQITVASDKTVTFNANGGSCNTPSSTVRQGSTITLPSASKAYSTFSGWFTAASGGTRVGGAGDIYAVNDNVTLYAQYNVIPVSITTTQATAYVAQGSSFAYTVGTNPSDASITVSGADWLTVSGKTIVGVPSSSVTPGTYHVTVTAHYGTQTDVQSFDVIVVQKLIFESVPTGGIIAVPA